MPTQSARRVVRCLAALVLLWACGPDPLEEARILQDKAVDLAGPLESLRALVEEHPDDPEIQYRYGLALLASNQPALALWPLQRAAKSPEWEERAHYALASSYLVAGSYDQAIDVIDREVERKPDNTAALTMRASAYIQSRRNYEAALADADRVLEIDPENTDVLPVRTIALLGLGRVDEAGEAVDKLDEVHRDDTLGLHGSPAYCTARAKFAQEKGELDVAEKRYTDCLAQFPTDSNVVHEAVAFYDVQGKVDRGDEILRAALDAVPEARQYRLALAARLRLRHREDEAEALLRKGAEHPEPLVAAEAWTDLAHFFIDSGRYDEAVSAYGEARRLAGPDDLLLFHTADALVIAGRFDEALATAEGIQVPVYQNLVRGRVALAQGDPEQALSYLQQGIELWPDNPFARYYAAVAAEQEGDFERAVEEYRYSMRSNVQATDAYLRLARLQDASGHANLALASLNFLPGSRPFERKAALLELRILARQGRAAATPPNVLQELGDPAGRAAGAVALAQGVRARAGAAEAVKTLRSVKGVALDDPVQAEALEGLVDLLTESGQAKQALAEVDRALRAHPDAAVFHGLRGRALVALGRSAEARAAFEKALSLEDDQSVALLGLARLESAAGAHDAARALYERAVARDPADAEALRGLAATLSALDRREEAEQKLEALLREHPYDTGAAMTLAELRLTRAGTADERTRELARRAVRFGGGQPAEALLERTGGSPPAPRSGAAQADDGEAPASDEGSGAESAPRVDSTPGVG